MEAHIEGKPAPDVRDYLAEERTFLAWIRTGLALMGFGFVVARFGLFLIEIAASREVASPPPNRFSLWFGTALIAAGVVVNLLSIRRHVRVVAELSRGHAARSGSPEAVVLALFLALIGMAMAFRLSFV